MYSIYMYIILRNTYFKSYVYHSFHMLYWDEYLSLTESINSTYWDDCDNQKKLSSFFIFIR